MDEYEKFMDEYVAFMKEYLESDGTDLGIYMEYMSLMGEYEDFCDEFEKWEDEDLNAAELAYYLDVQSRVSQKLLEIY